MYTDNALFFPKHVIPSLRPLRGDQWAELIDHIATLPENHEESLAFMLMMVHLNGCLGCETDSYRAMRGCCGCAHQTVRRFKGSDDELLELFENSLDQVRTFANRGTPVAQLIETALDQKIRISLL